MTHSCHSCTTTTSMISPTCFTEGAVQLSFGLGVLSGTAAGALTGGMMAIAGLIASGPAILLTAAPVLGASVVTGAMLGTTIGLEVGLTTLVVTLPFAALLDLFTLPVKALTSHTFTVHRCHRHAT